MNSCEFLQSLFAMDSTIAIPFECIATAPETVIDQAWQMAIEQQVTLYDFLKSFADQAEITFLRSHS